MEIKQLSVPIKDFDQGGYDEVEFISKPNIPIKEKIVSPKILIEENQEIDLINATGNQLLKYFLKRFNETHGYEYRPDWPKDTKTLNAFRDRYSVDAGPMIKVLFDKHKGKLSAADGVITVTAFARGSKWIQDMLYCDLQEDKKQKQSFNESTEGLMSSYDFRRVFRLAQ